MSLEKLENAIHFIVSRVPDPTKLGSVRLHKALWLTDLIHYTKTGKSMTEVEYTRQQMGPCVDFTCLECAIGKLVGEDKISKEVQQYAKANFHLYTSLKSPDKNYWNEQQEDILTQVVAEITKYSANELSEFTHNKCWKMLEDNEIMPLQVGLVSSGDKTPDHIIAWGKEQLQTSS